jgi:hypothetical protein
MRRGSARLQILPLPSIVDGWPDRDADVRQNATRLDISEVFFGWTEGKPWG